MGEIKLVIKDCIFEGVMMGGDIREVLRDLHFRGGFERKDILEAYNEMVAEAREADEEEGDSLSEN